jgi:hypothetical protein
MTDRLDPLDPSRPVSLVPFEAGRLPSRRRVVEDEPQSQVGPGGDRLLGRQPRGRLYVARPRKIIDDDFCIARQN